MGENENRSNVTECTAKRQKTVDESLSAKNINLSVNIAPLHSEDADLHILHHNSAGPTNTVVGPGGDFMTKTGGCVKCFPQSPCKESLPSANSQIDCDGDSSRLQIINGIQQCNCNIQTECVEDTYISQVKSINDLPHTILISIFQSLSLSDILLCVSLVCKFWRNLCCDSDIWRDIDLRGRIRVTDAILLRLTSYSGNVNSLDLTDVRLITNEGIQSTLKQCPKLKTLSLVRYST